MKQEIKNKMIAILTKIANEHSYESWGELMYDSHEHTQIEYTIAAMEEYASKGMPDKENEPVAKEKAMEYAVDFYQSNGALDGMPKSIVDDAHRLAALHFSKGYEYAKHKSNLLYDLLKDHTDETIHAQADRIKELEAENEILKMENSHSKLVVDEAKREIDRLKWLINRTWTDDLVLEFVSNVVLGRTDGKLLGEYMKKFKANNNL